MTTAVPLDQTFKLPLPGTRAFIELHPGAEGVTVVAWDNDERDGGCLLGDFPDWRSAMAAAVKTRDQFRRENERWQP